MTSLMHVLSVVLRGHRVLQGSFNGPNRRMFAQRDGQNACQVTSFGAQIIGQSRQLRPPHDLVVRHLGHAQLIDVAAHAQDPRGQDDAPSFLDLPLVRIRLQGERDGLLHRTMPLHFHVSDCGLGHTDLDLAELVPLRGSDALVFLCGAVQQL